MVIPMSNVTTSGSPSPSISATMPNGTAPSGAANQSQAPNAGAASNIKKAILRMECSARPAVPPERRAVREQQLVACQEIDSSAADGIDGKDGRREAAARCRGDASRCFPSAAEVEHLHALEADGDELVAAVAVQIRRGFRSEAGGQHIGAERAHVEAPAVRVGEEDALIVNGDVRPAVAIYD